jgi:hypothetical protein
MTIKSMYRLKKLITSSASWWVAICCLVSFSGSCQGQQRRPSLYLIPDGYVGWVRIDFSVEPSPGLSLEDGYYLLSSLRQG